MNDITPFKHGEEETHYVCNKHNRGDKSVCCECTGKTDCSDNTMKTLDTLIEEEKKEAQTHIEQIIDLTGYGQELHPNDIKHHFEEVITTAITKGYELALEEVGKEIEGVADKMSWDITACSQFPDSKSHTYAKDYMVGHYNELCKIVTHIAQLKDINNVKK